MNKEEFAENGFIIDLSNAKGAAQLIYELSSILEMPEASEKKICLKLGDTDLSRGQLISLRSLIESMENELSFIDTKSEVTEQSAIDLGIIVSELKNDVEIPVLAACDECFDAVEAVENEKSEDEPESTYVQMDTKDLKLDIEDDNEEKYQTLYMAKTLRSGQTLTYDGNVVIIGDVQHGSEVIARGDITVWGILGGIAHAGAKGNEKSKIRALKLNAIQLRIAGHYARRPDTKNIPFIKKTDTFTPEP